MKSQPARSRNTSSVILVYRDDVSTPQASLQVVSTDGVRVKSFPQQSYDEFWAMPRRALHFCEVRQRSDVKAQIPQLQQYKERLHYS